MSRGNIGYLPSRRRFHKTAMRWLCSHEVSLFRRSSIRPSLEQGYSGLCSDKVPVTKFLFGDKLADSMKEVQETNKLCSHISQHAKTTPSHGGKQYHNNKGYYKKSNKNHFLGQNYHGQSYHRGQGRGANNNKHCGKRKSTNQRDKQE